MRPLQLRGRQEAVLVGVALGEGFGQQGTLRLRRTQLAVLASDSRPISSVGFSAGGRQIGRVRENSAGVYSFTWSARGKGKRVLTAVVSDTAGREAQAKRVVRVCG